MKKQLFFALLLTAHIACASGAGSGLLLTFHDTSGIENPEYRTQTGTGILTEALKLLVEKRDTEHQADIEKAVEAIRKDLSEGHMTKTGLVRKDNVAAMMLDIIKMLINLGDRQPVYGDTDFTEEQEKSLKYLLTRGK